MKKVIFVFLIGMLLVSCDPVKSLFEKRTIDREEKSIAITVRFYDNSKQVTDKYKELHNIPKSADIPDHFGFAIWPEWKDKEGNSVEVDDLFKCDIYSTRPKTLDDESVLTLGHEVLHCLWGEYHSR